MLLGTVRTLDGRAIANAEVCASCERCDSTRMPAAVCARTGASGAYALQASTAKQMVVSAIAEGYDIGYAHEGLPIDVEGKPQSGLDITLQPGGAQLSGTVLDALGGPIARARVMIEGSDVWKRWLRETTTDDDGHFTLQTARGFQTVRAENAGYAPRSKTVVAPARDFTIQLAPESVVRGRVVAGGTGEPVAGVEVSARPDGFQPRSPSALSDQDGQFELSGLEPGRFLLAASNESWRASGPAWIDVHLADVMKDVVLEVAPAVRIVGHVQRRDRDAVRPCSQGIVTLEPARTGGAPWLAPQPSRSAGVLARIERDGSARFSGAAPGHYDVRVRCAGHVLADGPRLLELTDKAQEVTWTVEPSPGLTIHVVDALARPVPNTSILLLAEPADRPGSRWSVTYTTDDRGNVVVRDDLVPGKYSALLQSEQGEGEPPSVQLRPGSPPAELTLKLAGSGSIDVIARDEAGNPVSGLHVMVRREAAATSSSPAPDSRPPSIALGSVMAREVGDGHYLLGPLKPASYEVRVEDGVNPSQQGGAMQRVQLRGGERQTLQVSLARNGVIRGKVVDEKGGPAENAWVNATPDGEDSSPMVRARFSHDPPGRVLTDAEGEFVLTGLVPGAQYTLRVKQPFENAAVLHGVREGQTVRFVLPAAGSIAGVLLDAQGMPLPHAPVAAQHPEAHVARDAVSGPDGAFAIERIPAGHVQLSAGNPALGIAHLEFDLAPGQRVTGQALSIAPPPAQLPQRTPLGTASSQHGAARPPTPGG